jgi:polyferredoxin
MSCGWLCPIGYGQDMLYKIKTVKIPLPNVLTYAKYLILIGVVLIITHLFEEPWFSKLCPAGLILAGMPWSLMDQAIRDMLRQMFWIKLGIVFGYLTWSTASKRPFCRTTCPLGTIYAFFNSFSFWQMRVDQSSCTRCGRCRDVCPMDISIYENTRSVECIRCLECTACPCVEHKSITSLLPAPSRRPDLAGAETW